MTLSSMTGFARISTEVDGSRFVWELKSVNARGLEIRLRLPPELDHLEAELRVLAREKLSRGSCFFALHQNVDGAPARLTLDEEALSLVVAAARRLAAEEGIAMPTADGLLSIPGVLRDGGAALAEDAAERRDAAVLESFSAGVSALNDARSEEGARLRPILDDHLASIFRLAKEASELAAQAPDVLRSRIREQVKLLLTETSSLDQERLHQEAVIAATKADVREEIDRLQSHVAGARKLLATGGAVGRRLEFLVQELNREANTLCAKAYDPRLTAIGLELKATIDQFREQALNLA
jgi:uncharacterized protein (TIGR00255 family)